MLVNIPYIEHMGLNNILHGMCMCYKLALFIRLSMELYGIYMHGTLRPNIYDHLWSQTWELKLHTSTIRGWFKRSVYGDLMVFDIGFYHISIYRKITS